MILNWQGESPNLKLRNAQPASTRSSSSYSTPPEVELAASLLRRSRMAGETEERFFLRHFYITTGAKVSIKATFGADPDCIEDHTFAVELHLH
jgi:hypothetical protein